MCFGGVLFGQVVHPSALFPIPFEKGCGNQGQRAHVANEKRRISKSESPYSPYSPHPSMCPKLPVSSVQPIWPLLLRIFTHQVHTGSTVMTIGS